VDAAGTYTAGDLEGDFSVTATIMGGGLSKSRPVKVRSPIVSLRVAPSPASVTSGGSLSFSVIATRQNGSTLVPQVTWTATGGNIDPSGVYSAGATPGVFSVTAALVGGAITNSAAVTVTSAISPVVGLSVSPNPASVPTGASQAFSATATRQDGSTFVPSVTWSATGGSISAGGIYTAGTIVGNFAVTASLAGGSLTASVPVAVSSVVSPIVSISVAPAAATVNAGATQAFSASATRQDGSTLVPSVTWTATGGTADGSGVYTAGSAGGSFRVIAVLQGGTLADTSSVTVVSPTVSLTLTPSAATVNTGASQAFAVSAARQDGSTYVPIISWSATGGTITAGGVYTAGSTAGSYRVIGVLQGSTLSDTSTITIPAPVLQAVILTPAAASVAAGATQQFSVSGQWSNGATTAPSVTYSATGGTITSGGLYTAGMIAGAFRVIAVQQGGSLADTSVVTVAVGTGTVLLSEGFENGNLGSRGWFDATSATVVSDARPGSPGTHALEWHWTTGSITPQGMTLSRIDFAPSGSVYLSYWVKQSSNWTGSGVAYHPHMFHFLTTADDHWIGPSRTHLTIYDELVYVPGQGGSKVTLSLQDALMIDPNNLMVDLTNVTELRAIGGFNGRPEPGLLWDAYDAGGGNYTNYKTIQPSTIVMTDATKNSWHHVESYWQLNTISGGKGRPDGVVQYWFDGALIVDRHDMYFRTAVNAAMQFRTFLMAPYIGDGAPRDEYMWIDDLVVSTAHP
jgi:hypothetical protein